MVAQVVIRQVRCIIARSIQAFYIAISMTVMLPVRRLALRTVLTAHLITVIVVAAAVVAQQQLNLLNPVRLLIAIEAVAQTAIATRIHVAMITLATVMVAQRGMV
jgi:hypothetical protein